MKFSNSRAVIALGFLAALVAGGLGTFVYVRSPRPTAALRGSELARELGCFACHGPGGTGGIPNPGSEEGQVPAWDGGTAMMYVKNEGEIREWILYGRPKRLQRKNNPAIDSGPEAHTGANAVPVRSHSLPLDMPAFDRMISEKQLDDLVAYYEAVAVFKAPPPVAQVGYQVASRLGCFGCHGPGGRVGSSNPRSFKGYIPPWQGKDFDELVKSDDELRRWILEGRIDRLESNPLARYFTRRQVIQMPAFRDVLRDEELEDLVTYVRWINQESETPLVHDGQR